VSLPSPPRSEDIQKEVFKQSYGEVLLFLKHQDDKINRVLTALAFLTAAGVALFVFSNRLSKPNPPLFADGHVPADDYFFGVFIVGVALSVALSLVSLDPTSFRPRFFGRREDDANESLLYYKAIADKPRAEWCGLIGAADLERRFVESLNLDAHRLSHRATHKVARFAIANVVVQTTVVALALLGVMRLVDVSLDGRWVVATAALAAYAVMPVVDFAFFWFLSFPDVRPPTPVEADQAAVRRDERRRLALAALFYVPFIGVSLAGLVTNYRGWEPVTFVLFGTLALRLATRLGNPWLSSLSATLTTLAGVAWFWCN
jgi:hypothetical protein